MAQSPTPEATRGIITKTTGENEPMDEYFDRTWSTDEYGPEFMLSDSDYEHELMTRPPIPATHTSSSSLGTSTYAEAKDNNVNKRHTYLGLRPFQQPNGTSTISRNKIANISSLSLIAVDSDAQSNIGNIPEGNQFIHEHDYSVNNGVEPQMAVPQGSQPTTGAMDWGSSSKHIYFNFSLVEELDGVPSPRPPIFWETYAIGMYFGENCSGIIFDCPFLVVRFKVLPPKPWPVTIAGLPAWITDAHSNNFPPFFGDRGASGTHFFLDDFAPITFWKTPHTSIFDGIISFFRREKLDLKSLTFLGNRWLVTLRGKRMFYTESLPAQAGGIPIFYKGEMDSFTQGQQRNMESCTDNKIESSYYTELMVAGMMVYSSSSDVFTISGTPLYNEITEELCITVSNHGFDIADTVYCSCTPDGIRKPIAVAFKDIEQTGIMLAPVKPRKVYIKEYLSDHCFFDKYLSGVEGLIVGTQLYRMESPWAEPCESVLVGIERTVEPGLQYSGEFLETYQTNILTYVSNDLMFPDQYFCGAQVFKPLTREVVALFHCGRNAHGVFSSASVQPLLEHGYQIPKADSDGLFSSVSED